MEEVIIRNVTQTEKLVKWLFYKIETKDKPSFIRRLNFHRTYPFAELINLVCTVCSNEPRLNKTSMILLV